MNSQGVGNMFMIRGMLAGKCRCMLMPVRYTKSVGSKAVSRRRRLQEEQLGEASKGEAASYLEALVEDMGITSSS